MTAQTKSASEHIQAWHEWQPTGKTYWYSQQVDHRDHLLRESTRVNQDVDAD